MIEKLNKNLTNFIPPHKVMRNLFRLDSAGSYTVNAFHEHLCKSCFCVSIFNVTAFARLFQLQLGIN